LTHGHVWPDWLKNILPTTSTHHEAITGYFATFEPEAPGPPKTKEQRQGPARARKPRNTCKKCNSGWMSGIEDDAIAVATPLIKGDDFQLTSEGQQTLASFLCLITMRLQFLGPMRPIPAEDRIFLKEHLEPPPIWAVWIAKYTGKEPDEHWSRFCALQVVSQDDSTPADKMGPHYCNTQTTTLVMGKLCAHLFSSTVQPILGYDGVRLTRIWPRSGFDLNTKFLPAIDDNAVVALHETLAANSIPVRRA
jgi:hypothetical protein